MISSHTALEHCPKALRAREEQVTFNQAKFGHEYVNSHVFDYSMLACMSWCSSLARPKAASRPMAIGFLSVQNSRLQTPNQRCETSHGPMAGVGDGDTTRKAVSP